ncbi:imelysin family protein [Aestuariibius insulae]|uniref:imelysin family protein n=1 Tax=Aestuariibius insulae TaxID=2058287 RepID=UPI00345ED994
MRLALALSLVAAPAFADVDAALDRHILPGHLKLAETTATLAAAAEEDCTPEPLKAPFNTAYDAWLGVSHIQFGPIEDQGLSLAMAFWPDPKDRTGKALRDLASATDPIVDDPDSFGEVSVAAQGFTALERLLYESQTDPDYACQLAVAIARDLARKSTLLEEGWEDHATLLRDAGANARYQSDLEAQRALFTALSTGLEFLHDQRLGRPLGTFDRPRPARAEARRSGRTLRHIKLSLAALEDLTTTMAADTPQTQAAFAEARARAAALNDPTLAGVADPASRFKIEVLQQAVRAVQLAVIEEIGNPLGIQAGFNALDGD